jgi:hypothetical protein
MTIIQIKVEGCHVSSKPKVEQRYYMDMPRNLIEIDYTNIENISNTKKEDMVIN